MTEYTALFTTAAGSASYNLEADSPEEALELAHKLWRRNPHVLDFDPFTKVSLETIEISSWDDLYDMDMSWIVWKSDALRLRQAADKLLEALDNALAVLASVKPSKS